MLKRERVEKRFERAPRLSPNSYAVDLSAGRLILKIRGSNIRDDGAGRVVKGNAGPRTDAVAFCRPDTGPDSRLQRVLDVKIQRRPDGTSKRSSTWLSKKGM